MIAYVDIRVPLILLTLAAESYTYGLIIGEQYRNPFTVTDHEAAVLRYRHQDKDMGGKVTKGTVEEWPRTSVHTDLGVPIEDAETRQYNTRALTDGHRSDRYPSPGSP